MQLEHSVSALSETRREAQAPCYGSTAGPPHPVPQLQASGTKVTLETVRSLGNNMRNLMFWHRALLLPGGTVRMPSTKAKPAEIQYSSWPMQPTLTSCKAGCGTGKGKIKSTLKRLQSIYLLVVFRGAESEGFFLMLQQLGMLPWSPTVTVPCKLAHIQRQRLLSFGILPLLLLIWWKQECWAQSWGRCLVLSPMNSVSPHPQQHRESLEQGWPHPSPRSGWVWSRGHAAEPLGHMIQQASYS